MVVQRLVAPPFRYSTLHPAQVKRPGLPKMAGIPAPQVVFDRGVVDARLFSQFTQGGFPRRFAVFNGALDQLHARLRMAEQQNAGLRRG
ncbi:hypothetical protein D3C76_1546540 [compost metagenome]